MMEDTTGMPVDQPAWYKTSGLSAAWLVVGGTSAPVYSQIPNLTAVNPVEFQEYSPGRILIEKRNRPFLTEELEWQALAVRERNRIKRLGYTDGDVDAAIRARRYGK